MRMSRHNMFMEIARVVAQRGTCPRLCVGAVVVVNNRPISIGYNGSSPGKPHCTDVGCITIEGNPSCIRTVHAEINAIDYAMKTPRHKDNTMSLYVTHSPCDLCAEAITDSPVDCVYFETPYGSPKGLAKLVDKGVRIFRVMPNGYTINGIDGELIEAT